MDRKLCRNNGSHLGNQEANLFVQKEQWKFYCQEKTWNLISNFATNLTKLHPPLTTQAKTLTVDNISSNSTSNSLIPSIHMSMYPILININENFTAKQRLKNHISSFSTNWTKLRPPLTTQAKTLTVDNISSSNTINTLIACIHMPMHPILIIRNEKFTAKQRLQNHILSFKTNWAKLHPPLTTQSKNSHCK